MDEIRLVDFSARTEYGIRRRTTAGHRQTQTLRTQTATENSRSGRSSPKAIEKGNCLGRL